MARSPILYFFVLLLGTTSAIAVLPPDPEAKRQLAGKWTIETLHEAPILGEIEFRADGTLTGDCTVTLPDGRRHCHFEGTWDVKDGTLIEKVTTSTGDITLEPGHETKDTLMEISDQSFKAKTAEGDIEAFSRK